MPFRIPWALECVWECPCLDLRHCILPPPFFLVSGLCEAQCLPEASQAPCCPQGDPNRPGWFDQTFGVWAPKKWGGSGPLAIPRPWSVVKVLFPPDTVSVLAQVSMGASPLRCPIAVYQAYHLGSRVLSFGEGGSGAPKNHIGGSGLIALTPHFLLPEHYGSLAAWLEALAAWVIPFFRSLLVILGCCLGRLLAGAYLGDFSVPANFAGRYLHGCRWLL